jgi:hypothetical protein
MSERPLFLFRLRMHFQIRGRSYPQRLRRIVGKALSVVSKLGLPVGVFRLRRFCARPHCYGECHGFVFSCRVQACLGSLLVLLRCGM